jgi:hypothetical protein
LTDYIVDGIAHRELTEEQAEALRDYGHAVEAVVDTGLDVVVSAQDAEDSPFGLRIYRRADAGPDFKLSRVGFESGGYKNERGVWFSKEGLKDLRDKLTEILGEDIAGIGDVIGVGSPEPDRSGRYRDRQGDTWAYGEVDGAEGWYWGFDDGEGAPHYVGSWHNTFDLPWTRIG